MHRGPAQELGSPLDLGNSSDLTHALDYRNAMYAPPYKSSAPQVFTPPHPRAGFGLPPSNQQPNPNLHLSFDKLPKPPVQGQRAALAPLPPPHQDAPSLIYPFDSSDDASSVSSRENGGHGPTLRYDPYNPTHALLEWRLRHQSKRLRKKLRAVRQEMKQMYEAIYRYMTMMAPIGVANRGMVAQGSASPHKPQGTSTVLWCLVVGLAVGFVFLLIFVILCWTRVSQEKRGYRVNAGCVCSG